MPRCYRLVANCRCRCRTAAPYRRSCRNAPTRGSANRWRRWCRPIPAPPAWWRCATGATPLPRACCWRMRPSARSTCSTTSGTTTCRAPCCSTRCARGRRSRRAGAACCSTTTTPAASTDARRAGRASQHRGAAVQSVQDAALARARLSHRLRAAQSAHAQQVVHRRQPGHDHRRAQCRRRILRRRPRTCCSSISTCWRSGRWCNDVSQDFDRYWNSASSYPAQRVLPAGRAGGHRRPGSAACAHAGDPRRAAYMDALADSPFVRELLAHRLPFEWAATRWSATIRRRAWGARSRTSCCGAPQAHPEDAGAGAGTGLALLRARRGRESSISPRWRAGA